MKRLVVGAYKLATDLLTRNRKTLDLLVERLLEKETLDGSEIDSLVAEALPSEAGA